MPAAGRCSTVTPPARHAASLPYAPRDAREPPLRALAAVLIGQARRNWSFCVPLPAGPAAVLPSRRALRLPEVERLPGAGSRDDAHPGAARTAKRHRSQVRSRQGVPYDQRRARALAAAEIRAAALVKNYPPDLINVVSVKK